MTRPSAPAPRGGSAQREESTDQLVVTAVLLSISGAEALLTEGRTEQAAGGMEPPSALPRGGRVPWQELLLAGERDDPLG